MKLIKKLEFFIMLCACIEGSFIYASERWPEICVSQILYDHLLSDSGALDRYLYAGGNPNISWFFNEAAGTNKFDIVTQLLSAGADINLSGPLDQGYDSTPLHAAINNISLSMVKLLVENGADLNKKDARDQTSVQFANVKLQEDPDDQDRREIKKYLDEIADHGIVFNASIDEITTAIAYQIHEQDAHEYPVAEASFR